MPKVLLTSVCRPLGVEHGDAPSVGYELLHCQVTRAQGLFSPRSHHVHFSLDYLAENLEAPTTVLHYPSRAELIRELARGYDYVCVTFLLATFHRMKELVALVREHAPRAQIVLGGYGTVLSDEVLAPWGDHVCREEGVAWLRRLLGEPPLAMPYRHPMIVNPLRVFGMKVSQTGIVVGGLGCPNGCDFCCTSHFFKRRHVRLLETGAELFAVVLRYLEIDPDLSLLIIDEDFLLNRRRALEFRDCVVRSGKALSIFVFSSIRALSQYAVEELLEMGIDGLWIGYEGKRSGYAKQAGRPVDLLFRELRGNGITILASAIVGFPYQTPAVIEEEQAGLLALEPVLTQYLIYGPVPGTPFFEQVKRERLFLDSPDDDLPRFARRSSGFHALVKHPTMTPAEIEAAQARCFEEDFRQLGPSIYRALEVWLLGYQKHRDSPNEALRRKADRFARELRNAYPIFLAGKLFAPNGAIRARIAALEARCHAALGKPSWRERALALVAAGMAAFTGVKLRLGWFEGRRLVRRVYRRIEETRVAAAWRRLRELRIAGLRVEVEPRVRGTIFVRLHGTLAESGARPLAERLRHALARRRERVVLDASELADVEAGATRHLAEQLRDASARIRVLGPHLERVAALVALFGIYR
ncbi:MAG: hypothetical protein JNL90_07500 [Planctomycetes bacterium]|nr:hypothetical protein [Planctomycetota bacterium]